LIITSHMRGRFHAAATYLSAQGKNEKIRTVDISDIHALNLGEAFYNMWVIAGLSKVQKPLHHISINPFKEERLNDAQTLRIVKRCEQLFGYKLYDHQRVIVEHIRDGRQHFHVMWNRISLKTGKGIEPGLHINKSIQIAREMERILGLKTLPPQDKTLRYLNKAPSDGFQKSGASLQPVRPLPRYGALSAKQMYRPTSVLLTRRHLQPKNKADSETRPFQRPEWEYNELLAWAWEHNRLDILTQFGIFLPDNSFEP